MTHLGKYIIAIGTAIVLVGAIIYFLGDKMDWIGHLPGDIRIEKENFRLYFPITTLLLFTLVLNFIIYIVRQFW